MAAITVPPRTSARNESGVVIAASTLSVRHRSQHQNRFASHDAAQARSASAHRSPGSAISTRAAAWKYQSTDRMAEIS